MAVRTDLSVDFAVAPRIVTVAAPSTTITVQDLYDTLATEQAKVQNGAFAILLKGSGKDALGGGRFVGITVALQNTQLAFAARAGPTYVQCTVTDGNFVAIDCSGNAINPITPTAFTQIVVQQATSPGLVSTGTAVTAQDKLDIADRVHDELLSDHVIVGSLGKVLADIKTTTRAGGPLKNQAFSLTFMMLDSDGVPKTGLSVTATITKDGGATVATTSAPTELGSGFYSISLTATEMNAAMIGLRFSATGARTQAVSIVTYEPA